MWWLHPFLCISVNPTYKAVSTFYIQVFNPRTSFVLFNPLPSPTTTVTFVHPSPLRVPLTATSRYDCIHLIIHGLVLVRPLSSPDLWISWSWDALRKHNSLIPIYFHVPLQFWLACWFWSMVGSLMLVRSFISFGKSPFNVWSHSLVMPFCPSVQELSSR